MNRSHFYPNLPSAIAHQPLSSFPFGGCIPGDMISPRVYSVGSFPELKPGVSEESPSKCPFVCVSGIQDIRSLKLLLDDYPKPAYKLKLTREDQVLIQTCNSEEFRVVTEGLKARNAEFYTLRRYRDIRIANSCQKLFLNKPLVTKFVFIHFSNNLTALWRQKNHKHLCRTNKTTQ